MLGNVLGTSLDNRSYEAVNRQRPASSICGPFAVLAISNNKAELFEIRVILYSEMARYIKQHPGCSFLIPHGTHGKLNRQSFYEGRFMPITDWKVKRLPDGKQSIALRNSEGLDLFRYLADSRSITPVSYSAGVARGHNSCYALGAFLALPLNTMFWLFARGTVRILKHRRYASQTS